MARGLYKLDITITPYPPLIEGEDGEPQAQPFGDVVEVGRGTKWAYLYSARNPHARLEAMGALLIADSWKAAAKAMTATDRGRVFDAEWEEVEETLDDKGEPTGEKRKVMRRGKLRDKPGGVSGKQPKLRELLVPVAFGERERDAEQRALNRETGRGA